MENQGIPKPILIGGAILIFFLFFGSKMFYNIKPGEKAVQFFTLSGGLDKDKIYNQGLNIIAPWNRLEVYNVKFQSTAEIMEVLSVDGLPIRVDLSFRYNPIPEKIGYLHDEIGREYLESIIKPEIRSITREVIGNYEAEELYSAVKGIKAIEEEIYSIASASLKQKFIFLDAILIKDITLPQKLRAGIEKKLVQEQEALEYKYKLEKEEKEAERKRIEAQGIADFQSIVTKTITEKLLKWKGVEATQEISKSNNSKVIVIGNGSDDLPIILGQ